MNNLLNSKIVIYNWVSDFQSTPYIISRTCYIRWYDNDIRFVLDQHAELDFYSASSLKQQSVGKHVAPLVHIILIPSPLV